MSETDTLRELVDFLVGTFEWLPDVFEDVENFSLFMHEFGWQLDPDKFDVDDFKSSLPALDAVLHSILQLAAHAEDLANADEADLYQVLGELTIEVISIWDDVEGLDLNLSLSQLPPPLNNQEFLDYLVDFPRLLMDHLIVTQLEVNYPRIATFLTFLGVISTEYIGFGPPMPGRVDYEKYVITWENLSEFFTNPLTRINNLYDWDVQGKEFKAGFLLFNLKKLLQAFGIRSGHFVANQDTVDTYFPTATDPADIPNWLRIPFYDERHEEIGSYVSVGLFVQPIPPSDPGRPSAGLLIGPYLYGTSAVEIPIRENVELKLSGDFTSDSTTGVEIRPGSLAPTTGGAPGAFRAGTELHVTWDEPYILLSVLDAIRLTLSGVRFGLTFQTDVINDYEIDFEAALEQLKLTVATGDADSFLAKLLPPDGITTEFDTGVGWSSKDGVYFRGSAALEITLPLHQNLGPLSVDELYIRLGIVPSQLELALGASFGAELGPIQANVQRVGLLAKLAFPSPTGASNKFDTSFGFLPPTGAGLVIDAGPITGGGFVEFNEKEERYVGILALNLAEIGITAIGLITTKLPDGRKTVSILISISVEFDPPIELSMGFTLSGVGGLVGINRAMVLEELQRKIRKGALDSILFPDPKKVVANAQNIIDDMRSVFPPHEGRFVVGPMVKFGWGSPNVIQAEVGVFLSLFDPVNIALLGKVHATFPTPDEDIIRINMHILGTLSFEKKEISFQSSIYDSSILAFTIAGDTAALLRWREPPEFTLALGGFHPKFPVPAPPRIFADLKRMSLNVSYGSEIFLMLQGYQALTPNSLQFGARVLIIVNVDPVSAIGEFGFDALFYFNPFSFEISADAKINITVLGATLVDADVDLKLSGPKPWNAHGHAAVHLLFVDADGSFNVTWGDTTLEATPAIDPLEPFLTALRDNHNWSARLPNSRGMAVMLHPMESPVEDGMSPPLAVHPAGSLEVRQTVLPLGMALKKFGNAPIGGHDRFEITRFSVGATSGTPTASIKEHFARSAFEKLSKDARLSRPSFEKITAGVRFSSDPIKFEGSSQAAKSGYESVYLSEDELSSNPADGSLAWQDAEFLIAGSASSKSAHLNGGMRKYKDQNMVPKVTVNEQQYTIVDLSTFTRAGFEEDIGDDPSLWHVEQVLDEYLAAHPEESGKLGVVAEYEVAQGETA